ncbi:hypothetical protein [Thiomonas sp. FB-6]|nr:hypothetical protein [Thiomonas sp. FB-6]
MILVSVVTSQCRARPIARPGLPGRREVGLYASRDYLECHGEPLQA